MTLIEAHLENQKLKSLLEEKRRENDRLSQEVSDLVREVEEQKGEVEYLLRFRDRLAQTFDRTRYRGLPLKEAWEEIEPWAAEALADRVLS